MSDYPIEALMKTAMESIREMVDVNTVVGDAVEAPGGAVIIPISKVSCGFAAGGGEYAGSGKKDANAGSNPDQSRIPFGGGSGAGVSVQPVGFLVVNNEQVRLLPVEANQVLDRVIDVAPTLLNQIQNIFQRKCKEKTDKTITRTTTKTVSRDDDVSTKIVDNDSREEI